MFNSAVVSWPSPTPSLLWIPRISQGWTPAKKYQRLHLNEMDKDPRVGLWASVSRWRGIYLTRAFPPLPGKILRERFSPKSNLRVLTYLFFCEFSLCHDSHLSPHLSLALTLAIAQAQIFCCLLGILAALLKPIPNRLHQEGSCSEYMMVYKAKNLTNNLYFLSLSP